MTKRDYLTDARDSLQQLLNNQPSSWSNYPMKFNDLFTAAGEFIDNDCEDVINAIDSAIERIQELEDELKEKEQRIEELENQLYEVGERQ